MYSTVWTLTFDEWSMRWEKITNVNRWKMNFLITIHSHLNCKLFSKLFRWIFLMFRFCLTFRDLQMFPWHSTTGSILLIWISQIRSHKNLFFAQSIIFKSQLVQRLSTNEENHRLCFPFDSCWAFFSTLFSREHTVSGNSTSIEREMSHRFGCVRVSLGEGVYFSALHNVENRSRVEISEV